MPEPHPVVVAVRRRREEKGLTQAALAAACGTTQSHVSEVEGGQTNVTVAVLDRWAKVLDLSLSVSYEGAPDAA